MLRRKKKKEIDTFLGPQTQIQGMINFEGGMRIEGKFEGDIFSKTGDIIVGPQAHIKGDLKVGSALVMGEVNGCIDAETRIEIHPPGKMIGDIRAPFILIDPGVVFNGQCIVTNEDDNNSEKSSDGNP
jgi:cytoskeletal protein CcmA (bactofilin family)